MAKEENRKRVNFILDLNKPREKALADFLETQFSISGTVKEALEEKMLRDNGRIIETAPIVVEEKEEEESMPKLEGLNAFVK